MENQLIIQIEDIKICEKKINGLFCVIKELLFRN